MEDKKVSWNVSQGLITEIGNRRSYANSLFIKGDIKGAFKTLISIRQSVVQSFTGEERTLLKEIEDKFNKLSSFLSSSEAISFNPESRIAFKDSHKLATKIYGEYNDKLMDLLEKYDYLIGEKADASRMKF